MNILTNKKQEIIRVLHNDAAHMRDNISMLRKDGWSGNTRVGFSGNSICRETVTDDDGAWISEMYPDVTIFLPEKGSYIHNEPYVYVTEHVRDIEEGE